MQVGWIIDGQRMTHAEAIAYARTYPENFDYDENMLSQMWQGHLRSYMSPTMFSGCVRQEVLKREVDYWLEPDKCWALLRGTVAHLIMERGSHEPDAIIEQRLACQIILPDGTPRVIQGTPDKVVPSQHLLIDYKTVQELEAQPKAYWVAQASCYRWMLHQHGITVNRMFIQEISMKRPRRLWLTQHLWSLEKAESYLMAKVPQFGGVFDGIYNLETLPPPLDFALAEEAWQCFPAGRTGIWCPVRDICFTRLAQEVRERR